MKNYLIVNAKYNQKANSTLISILNGLSDEDREKERGSYYGSLSGLVAHNLGGTTFFMSLFKDAVAHNPAASKVYDVLGKIDAPPKGPLTGDQWKSLVKDLEAVDQALVDFVSALEEKDLEAPVKVPFYRGNPESAPLAFLLINLAAHGTHHRGQASQILDEMKVDNNYSGVDIAFLSK